MDNDLSATAHDFTAARDGSSYRLAGMVTTNSTGWTIEVHSMSDGIVDDPEIARFLLHAIPPDADIVIEYVVTENPVEETFEDAPELKTVFIHLQGATNGQGGHDIEVPVG